MPIQLGPFTFESFEIPEVMKFGGPEHLAIHRQPNGARTIDILGRDDTPFVWSGIFISANASDRAKVLEGLKVASGIYSLTFGNYQHDVVISKLDFVYHRQNWIDYTIECTPVFGADDFDPAAKAVANPAGDVGAAAGAGQGAGLG